MIELAVVAGALIKHLIVRASLGLDSGAVTMYVPIILLGLLVVGLLIHLVLEHN